MVVLDHLRTRRQVTVRSRSAGQCFIAAIIAAQPQIQGAAGASLGEGFQAVYLTAAIAAAASAVLTLFISGHSSPAPEVNTTKTSDRTTEAVAVA